MPASIIEAFTVPVKVLSPAKVCELVVTPPGAGCGRAEAPDGPELQRRVPRAVKTAVGLAVDRAHGPSVCAGLAPADVAEQHGEQRSAFMRSGPRK